MSALKLDKFPCFGPFMLGGLFTVRKVIFYFSLFLDMCNLTLFQMIDLLFFLCRKEILTNLYPAFLCRRNFKNNISYSQVQKSSGMKATSPKCAFGLRKYSTMTPRNQDIFIIFSKTFSCGSFKKSLTLFCVMIQTCLIRWLPSPPPPNNQKRQVHYLV